jgi:hypothetical protein
MSIIDIRDKEARKIDTILFGRDACVKAVFEDTNEKLKYGVQGITINSDAVDGYNVVAVSPDDIPNLIKALEKCIELGWTK